MTRTPPDAQQSFWSMAEYTTVQMVRVRLSSMRRRRVRFTFLLKRHKPHQGPFHDAKGVAKFLPRISR